MFPATSPVESQATAAGRGVAAAGDISGTVITGDIHGDVRIEVKPPPEIPSPPAPARLPASAGFIGREAEIHDYLEKLAQSHLAVITGMPGVGKTSLAAALARRSFDPYRIFWHSFHKNEGVDALVWELAAFLAWNGQPDLWQMLNRLQQAGGRLPPREVIFDYLLQNLRGRGLLLCLDDFHFVEQDALLGRLVEELRGAILAGDLSLILTSRRMPDFVRAVQFEPLEGLNQEDAFQLMRARGLDLNAELAGSLYTRTGGNAQLLTLAMVLFKATPDPVGQLSRLAEARDIERYLLSEVDAGLSEAERAVMGAVAMLLGYPASRGVVAELLGGDNPRRELNDLCDRHLLIQREAENGQQYQQHAMVQAFYYDSLDKSQRREMHARAAAYYRAVEPDSMKAVLHLDRSGEAGKAAELAFQELTALINRGQARLLLNVLKGLDLARLAAQQQAQVHLATGRLNALVGERKQARRDFDAAQAVISSLPHATQSRPLEARLCYGMGELVEYETPVEALEWLQRGRSALDGLDPTLAAELNVKAGEIQTSLGNYPAALDLLTAALAQLPDSPSQARETAFVNLGAVYFLQGELDRAEQANQDALEISQQIQDEYQGAIILMNQGVYQYTRGKWRLAMDSFSRALAQAERLGSQKTRASLEVNLGAAYINTGEDDAARRHLLNGKDLAHSSQLVLTELVALQRLADLAVRQRDWGGAQAFLAEAEGLVQQVDFSSPQIAILSTRAELLLATGQPEPALQAAEQSVSLGRELGEDFDLGIALRVLGQAQQAEDLAGQALASYAESLEILKNLDPYEAARTELAWGQALTGGPHDSTGEEWIEKARATFEALGAARDLSDLDSAHAGKT